MLLNQTPWWYAKLKTEDHFSASHATFRWLLALKIVSKSASCQTEMDSRQEFVDVGLARAPVHPLAKHRFCRVVVWI
jgi:hypothetical protein